MDHPITRKIILAGLFAFGLTVGFFIVKPYKASAGDWPMVGVLQVSDAGTVSNWSTGVPFELGGSGTLLSVQCDNDCAICTDTDGCDAGNGVHLPTPQMFETSISNTIVRSICSTQTNPDAGAVLDAGCIDRGSGILSVAPLAGSANCLCHCWPRRGNE